MWDYPSLYGKALLYFRRADNHPRFDDDEFGIWTLLGLEFLLRSPLAKMHSSLLAAPEGNSILHAVGILTEGDVKSVPTHTVITRLPHIVPKFDNDRVRDAKILMNIRNAELHTGDAALANTSMNLWLPRFLRVAEAICEFLDVEVEDLLGESVVAHARSLVDEEDKRIESLVKLKISEAEKFFESLREAVRSGGPLRGLPGMQVEDHFDYGICKN